MCKSKIFHTWTNWKDIKTNSILRVIDDSEVGIAITQERRCESCNKVKLRTIKTFL